jgi:heptose I phosphotransferase
MIEIAEELLPCVAGEQAFDQLMHMHGEIFRELPTEGRRTLRFSCQGRSYFIKIHRGVGWREIFKNLFSLRLPVISARNEWRAIERLEQLGIPTTPLVARGARGINPARRESFVVTRDLGATISLEDLTANWSEQSPPVAFKRALIDEVARIARLMHDHGMNHRDFYLCHFLLDQHEGWSMQQPTLYLIDLHRVQMRRRVPRRWLVKDLGGLYFSALDAGLSRHDVLRFLRGYFDRPLREILAEHDALFADIIERARRFYISMHGREPVLP